MIWTTWRQYRTTILTAVGTILAPAVVAALSGIVVRPKSNQSFENAFGCTPTRGVGCWAETSLTLITLLTLALPVLVGALVGVTVFSRDIERGTHVLGLTQSVSRMRWYWTRIPVVFAPIVVAMTILGAVLEWTRGRSGGNYSYVSQVLFNGHSQLSYPMFQSTGLIAGAYTILGLAVGSCLALLLRNTLGAMVITLIATTAVLVGFQLGARPHYATPRVEVQALGSNPYGAQYTSDNEAKWTIGSAYVDANGRDVDFDYSSCTHVWNNPEWEQRPDETGAEYEERRDVVQATTNREFATCQRAQGIDRFEVRYHPDSLLRRFQVIEVLLASTLSALLLIPSLWAVRRLRP
ncbi:ABC transporter permease [Prescottella subtropica]|uniref:ABC transporter permease n=1 Tax=Prescottella subtropica TaxID=2545757 RepID=UPI0010F73557|nr:ABC transporter permease [Prescottella subtropica]